MKPVSDTIKGLVLLNSTAKADSEERKLNRDRAIKAVKARIIYFYIGFCAFIQ
jgi:L-asparagine transporter-like permease